MAANNAGAGGAGGGRQGNSQMNEHVEFSVKAEEDLYLTGSENTIRRVTAETNYSCLMLKTQRFSSLFRHYAKYHGLRKDDLEYYFVNLLENEDTPESVQLQRGDTIMVRKRRKTELPEAAADDDEFYKDMRELLSDEEHMDCVFTLSSPTTSTNATNTTTQPSPQQQPLTVVPMTMTTTASTTTTTTTTSTNNTTTTVATIRAHKCILTARTEYFKALFRNNTFKESADCVVTVDATLFTEQHVRFTLEFIYTNRIKELREIATDDLLCLLHLADRWLLRDLKRLVEHEIIRNHLSVKTVGRIYGATETFGAKRLSRSCIEFIMANFRSLAGNEEFEDQMKNYPHLFIPVLKAAADLIPDPPGGGGGGPQAQAPPAFGPAHKKQRTSNNNNNDLLQQQQQQQQAGRGEDAAVAAAAVAAAMAGGARGGGGLGSSPVPDSDT